ncbi:MAG: hypothetical protein NZ775_00590 [Gammaproteobacteria bacterium]|nr:hypothetical protein [Gammaproteobacteria bacterium]
MIGFVFLFNTALSLICPRSHGFIHVSLINSALALSETKILASQNTAAEKILGVAL